MPDRVLALPVRTRHRRNPIRTRVLDVTAKLGSGVILASLVVVGATTATSVAAEPDAPVVTFQYARH